VGTFKSCNAVLLLRLQALFAAALTGGGFTGAALNPARVLGEIRAQRSRALSIVTQRLRSSLAKTPCCLLERRVGCLPCLACAMQGGCRYCVPFEVLQHWACRGYTPHCLIQSCLHVVDNTVVAGFHFNAAL
jgi:hypothetical protein